jgi:hypothetical protein
MLYVENKMLNLEVTLLKLELNKYDILDLLF